MSLKDQPWYWGNVDKAFVCQMMAEQNNGAFMVRDASVPGDYTLTIRFNNKTKLVRIYVRKCRCGFSPESLNHDSVVALIDFHRTCNLKVYNDQLDTCLLTPVCRSIAVEKSTSPIGTLQQSSTLLSSCSSTSSASSTVHTPRPIVAASTKGFNVHSSFMTTDSDWEVRLGLERLRISQTAVDRAARLFDAVHSESQRAETIHHALTKSLADLTKKKSKLDEIFETQNSLLDETSDSTVKSMLPLNQKAVQLSLKNLETENKILSSQKNRLVEVMTQMKEEETHAKNRLVFDQDIRNAAYRDLHERNVSRSKLDATAAHSLEMIAKETMQVSMLLADLPLPWDPIRYLVNDACKDAAASLIVDARNRAAAAGRSGDGIFVVRPSSSHANKLVLSVLNGGRVSHCLIEQNEQGWGFENGGLYFVTIGDFVRYYAHASLEEHNKDIKTVLTMPAL